jgi:hypothetical protein
VKVIILSHQCTHVEVVPSSVDMYNECIVICIVAASRGSILNYLAHYIGLLKLRSVLDKGTERDQIRLSGINVSPNLSPLSTFNHTISTKVSYHAVDSVIKAGHSLSTKVLYLALAWVIKDGHPLSTKVLCHSLFWVIKASHPLSSKVLCHALGGVIKADHPLSIKVLHHALGCVIKANHPLSTKLSYHA